MNPRVMRTRFFGTLILLTSVLHAFSQDATQQPVEGYNYDRCEDHEFGGWKTISVQFQEEGGVFVEMDDYVIKSEFANQEAYDEEVSRIDNLEGSLMAKLEAKALMYDNALMTTSGIYENRDGVLKITLESDDMLDTDILHCEIGGRYLKCSNHNFALTYDEVILDFDVINITNIKYKTLTYQLNPQDRWIIHLADGNDALENGENFQLESLYARDKYLGHGKDGLLKLYALDEQGINYEFRFYDEYGEGPLAALDDLKLKPAYFFGDYSYVVGVDQEADNARISKQYEKEENLWYVEAAMCDIVDELIGEK